MGVFNAEDTIEDCIESIESQSYTNWEFIICDDCSTDRTNILLKKFAEKDSRIIIIKNEKNMRLAASLNKCLDIAKGKYIARMDADDLSLPTRLERQVHFLECNQEIDCVGTSRFVFDNDGNKMVRKSCEYPCKEILLHDTPFAHPTIMMKKTVYDSLNGYCISKETMRAEDLELWFRFFEKGYRGYNIQDELYMYREDIEDYRKRSVKSGFMTAKVFLNGYKRLKFPVYKWFFAVKPIVSALIPNKIIKGYHNINDGSIKQ